MSVKECRTCHETKSETDFYTHPTTKDRLTLDCKTCHKAWMAQRRLDVKEGREVVHRAENQIKSASTPDEKVQLALEILSRLRPGWVIVTDNRVIHTPADLSKGLDQIL